MLYTRRDLGKIALAAVPLAKGLASVDSKFGGVNIVRRSPTVSGRPSDIDEIIKDMSQIGLGEAELMSNHAEAAAGSRRSPPAVAVVEAGEGRGQGRGQGAGVGAPALEPAARDQVGVAPPRACRALS